MGKSSVSPHNSYFWKCLTLDEDCPLFSTTDPKLYYFVLGLIGLYVAFLVIVFVDLSFYWDLGQVQQQIDSYVSMITNKLWSVKKNQDMLLTTQERTEKQLHQSRESTKTLTALRNALTRDDMNQFAELIQAAEGIVNEERPHIIREKLRENNLNSTHL